MPKKRLLTLILSSFLFSGCSVIDEKIPVTPSPPPTAPVPSPRLSSPATFIQSEYTARFEIYTNGTKRIFTDSKYHRQSADIYIENPDPHLMYVKKPNLTWNDFFKTLPFSVKKECLVTGTKQTFCNTETKRLYFYLNGQEEPDALDKVILANDSLRVEYR
jgi:hypothetical protein